MHYIGRSVYTKASCSVATAGKNQVVSPASDLSLLLVLSSRLLFVLELYHYMQFMLYWFCPSFNNRSYISVSLPADGLLAFTAAVHALPAPQESKKPNYTT